MRKALERITIKPPLHWIKFHIMDTKDVYIFLVVLLYEDRMERRNFDLLQLSSRSAAVATLVKAQRQMRVTIGRL